MTSSPTLQPLPAAIITGAGSGIGRATAILLAASGYRLALLGRRTPPLAETAALLPPSADALITPCDIGDPAQAAAAVDACLERFARLDALINNAGLAPLAAIDKTTPQVIDDAYRVNALGPAYLIARAWPAMTRQRAGCIINISTLGTIDPFPGFFAYASSKAAVNLMVRSCANEGKPFNIRAFAIAPGAVETDMLRANFSPRQIPPADTLAPERVAELILACIRGRHDARNGDTIPISSKELVS